MKKFALLIATAIMVITNVHAFDVKLLANNKETFSRLVTKQNLADLAVWKRHHRLRDGELKAASLKTLSLTFNEMERIDTNCELGLVTRLESDAVANGVIASKAETVKSMIRIYSSTKHSRDYF